MTFEQGITEGRKKVMVWFNNVLKINAQNRETERIFRVRKAMEMGRARPLFIGFGDRTTNDEVMDLLSNLIYAEDK